MMVRRLGMVMALLAIALAGACGDDADDGSTGVGGAAGSSASGGTGNQGGVDSGVGGVAGQAAAGGVAASGGSVSGGAGGQAGSADAGLGGSAGIAGADGSGDSAPSLPLAGFGTITGDCGPIDVTEILSASPFTFETHLDFGSMSFDYSALSLGGKQVYDAGNLGGSSLYSEIFSYEVLYRCELATLLETEGKIQYVDAGGKKTDLLVEIDGYKIGVSVTRAFAYPPGTTYTVTAAQSLLEGKLGDVLLSTQNVKPVHAWQKQILHVLAYDNQHRDALFSAYPQIPAATRADTLVVITVTDGADAFVY